MAGGAGGPPPGTVSDPGASLAAALMAAMARRQRQQQMQEMAVAPGPGLQEVLKPEVLTPLLQDPEVSMLVTCYFLVWCVITGTTHAQHLRHLTASLLTSCHPAYV
jgi:hypothetical protein